MSYNNGWGAPPPPHGYHHQQGHYPPPPAHATHGAHYQGHHYSQYPPPPPPGHYPNSYGHPPPPPGHYDYGPPGIRRTVTSKGKPPFTPNFERPPQSDPLAGLATAEFIETLETGAIRGVGPVLDLYYSLGGDRGYSNVVDLTRYVELTYWYGDYLRATLDKYSSNTNLAMTDSAKTFVTLLACETFMSSRDPKDDPNGTKWINDNVAPLVGAEGTSVSLQAVTSVIRSLVDIADKTKNEGMVKLYRNPPNHYHGSHYGHPPPHGGHHYNHYPQPQHGYNYGHPPPETTRRHSPNVSGSLGSSPVNDGGGYQSGVPVISNDWG